MQKISNGRFERCSTIVVRRSCKVGDDTEAVAHDGHVAFTIQAPFFCRSSQRVHAFPVHQWQLFAPSEHFDVYFLGPFFNTTSGSSVAVSRCSSSSGNSHPRRMPLAFLKTPFLLASAFGESLKIMGKSRMSGKSPGIPEVRPTGSCSRSSFRSSPLDPFRRAAASA